MMSLLWRSPLLKRVFYKHATPNGAEAAGTPPLRIAREGPFRIAAIAHEESVNRSLTSLPPNGRLV
jgi:hypothetical protein